MPVEELVAGLLKREEDALSAGFVGLRTNGNCAWVSDREWADFQRYETHVQGGIEGRRMICMCSYHPEGLQRQQMIDEVDRHDLVLSQPSDYGASSRQTGRSPVSEVAIESGPDLPALRPGLSSTRGS